MRTFALVGAFSLTIAFAIPATAQDCGTTHAKVGWQAKLASHSHGTSGTVKIVDDCTLQVDNFNFDGKGLNVVVVVADNPKFKNRVRLSDDIHGKGAYKNASLTVKLKPGMSLDNFDYVSIWCTVFGANFADGKFAAP